MCFNFISGIFPYFFHNIIYKFIREYQPLKSNKLIHRQWMFYFDATFRSSICDILLGWFFINNAQELMICKISIHFGILEYEWTSRTIFFRKCVLHHFCKINMI